MNIEDTIVKIISSYIKIAYIQAYMDCQDDNNVKTYLSTPKLKERATDYWNHLQKNARCDAVIFCPRKEKEND